MLNRRRLRRDGRVGSGVAVSPIPRGREEIRGAQIGQRIFRSPESGRPQGHGNTSARCDTARVVLKLDMTEVTNPLPLLELPKRWELLAQRAYAAGLDAGEFVERVDSAAERVDHLLTRVRTGGGGLFEIFLGLSGSGKTTFLNTLPRFFTKIRVHPFPRSAPLSELPDFVASTHVAGDEHARVILVERRDNPSEAELSEANQMFASLLEVFRDPQGGALVIWPITSESSAQTLASAAWDTGRDSVCDGASRGLFRFSGVPKARYFAIADFTSRNLTGDGLEAFGVTEDIATELLPPCETIADFFYAVDRRADEKRKATWSVLRERVRARVWVVLPGDVVQDINATVSALTQGTRNRIDIDLIGEFIDKPSNTALYINDWRKRRASLAHFLRAIDLRHFGLPPNLALAAARSFGDDAVKKLLKQPAVNLDQAKEAMRASRLYKAILSEAGINTAPFAGGGSVSAETSNEYRRLQSTAGKSDKPLNKALGMLIETCLAEGAPSLKVLSEKRKLPGSELQPDIQIQLSSSDFICLEPTWRSTDVGIPGELDGGQNTLAEAHLKKYVLDKAAQYVRDLGL